MYQQIILVGNVGKDGATMRYTPSGTPVSSFSLATNKSWTKDGEKQDKSTWWKINCWNKLAEIVSQYVAQGNKVMVIGELDEARTWTDRDGNTRVSLEITAREVKFLGGKTENNTVGNEALGNPNAALENETSVPF